MPRIIAIGILVYLVYSLVIIGDTLRDLHIWVLAIMLALVLAPMASRLKILNIVDFSSKLNNLTKEQKKTKSELTELRNQISSYIDIRVKPVQQQTAIFSLANVKELQNAMQELKQPLTGDESEIVEKEPESARQQFLMKADSYRHVARNILHTAFTFQIAILKRRLAGSKDKIKGNTTDEKIRYLLRKVLDNGTKTILPIMLVDEKTKDIKPLDWEGIAADLQQLETLLDLRQKILDREIQLPQQDYIDKVFDRVNSALQNIAAGISIMGSAAIIYQYDMTNKIRELKRGLGMEEEEQK